VDLGVMAPPAWGRIFPARVDPRRNVTAYLKLAHPGMFIVALSLPEDDDGDAALELWERAMPSLAAEFPDVVFCVLNRVGPGPHARHQAAEGTRHGPLALVRQAGLTLADAVALAQMADAFVGPTDVFGLAALTARRPGVYMDPSGTVSSADQDVFVTRPLAPKEAFARLRSILEPRRVRRAPTSLQRPLASHVPPARHSGRPTVAVILSNNNHGRYLPQSLGGICEQTRPADEIVVIDDGSLDSVGVIEEFTSRYPQIRFFRNPRNMGLQASIARVLPLVHSDYLVWAASDDRLLPSFLDRSMAVLDRHPQAGLCFSELAVIRPEPGDVQRFAVEPSVRHIFDLSDLPEYMTPAQVMRRMKRAYLPITSNSVVVRRDALLAMGGYPGDLEWCSDSFAYVVIALRHGACVVPEPLALIRPNPGSYSDRVREDSVRQRKVLMAMLDILARPEYRDVRRALRACPSNFSPWRGLMLKLQLRNPRDWDLFVPYLMWKIREYKRGHRLTWRRTAWELGVRGEQAVARRVRAGASGLQQRLRARVVSAPVGSAASAVSGEVEAHGSTLATRAGLDAYSMVIMTYNRAALLSRLLDYLEHFKPTCPIIVLDSSADESREKNAARIGRSPLRVQHAVYPSEVDPYVKVREGLGRVTTPYCSLCADDDVVMLATIERCVAELERDPGAVAAHGYYFNFQATETFDLSYIVYRGGSLLADDPIVRLHDMFRGYEAVFYGVHRTTVAQSAFCRVDELETVLGRELLTAALTAVAGRIVRVESFYYGRSTTGSILYENWHPHQILSRSPEVLFQEYPQFRRLVLDSLAEQAGAVRLQATGEVLDLMFLRYLAPYLRTDVMDLIIADRLRGESPKATAEHLWNVYVRTGDRTVHPIEALAGRDGEGFAPDEMRQPWGGRDYIHQSRTVSGAMRRYRVFYEFLFPDSKPPPVVRREQLMPLLHSLDAY